MKTLFVVDDNTVNLLTAEETLSDHYNVITLASASIMFEFLNNIMPDLILLDIMMPEMDGFEALKLLKADKRYSDIPVIFLTSKNDSVTEAHGFEAGAVDFICKPFSRPVLLNRIKTHLDIETIIRERTAMLEQRTDKLFRLQNSMASVLANIVENRDMLTGEHIQRTTSYISILLNNMARKGLYYDEISSWSFDMIISAARLHDLGKIVVSDTILNKPGKLSQDEYETIKTHSMAGEKIIGDIMTEAGDDTFLLQAKILAGSHHECWNGTGYPRGLKGLNIPLQGRIMAIADVYDALVSDRPYKSAFTHDEAIEIITKSSGVQFDPEIVSVFLSCENEFLQAVTGGE
jgi:putative two-component system response regulator